MTKIDKFVDFTKTLSGQERSAVESMLDMVMQSYDSATMLSADQMIKDDRRFADLSPEYAEAEMVNAIFGRSIAS